MKTTRRILSVFCVLYLSFINGYSATEQIFFDDFESAKGWVRNPYGTDNATTGLWERDDPEGSYYGGAMQLNATISGTKCLVTNRLAGYYPGDYDVDNGNTTVRSPAIQLPADGNLTLSMYYNFAHYSNATSADYFRVKIIGNTTVQVFEVLGSATVSAGMWKYFTVNISSFKGQSIYILIEAADYAEASLVEAAIEDVLIENEIVPPGERDSLVVRGKIMLHPYNNDTARAVQLYGNYQTEPEDHISFEIQVPPTLNPMAQRYTFDDLAFRTTADITTTADMDCSTLQCGNVTSSGDIQCLSVTAQNSINCRSFNAGEMKIDGDIWARKVTVTLSPFPDYVFTKEYSLMPLPELEKFIQTNGHLPGIPQESEVLEKGVDIGQLQGKLLEKIEEMTLRIIEMNKEIEYLKKNQK